MASSLTPDADVAAVVAAILGSGWAVGTNVFTGPVRPVAAGVPYSAIFCLATGGPPPEPFLGVDKDRYLFSVQVAVRGGRDSFGATRARARALRNGLHRRDVTGYYAVRVRDAEPIFLGLDASGSPDFRLNVQLEAVA